MTIYIYIYIKLEVENLTMELTSTKGNKILLLMIDSLSLKFYYSFFNIKK
jgi:hypothetical protein